MTQMNADEKEGLVETAQQGRREILFPTHQLIR